MVIVGAKLLTLFFITEADLDFLVILKVANFDILCYSMIQGIDKFVISFLQVRGLTT